MQNPDRNRFIELLGRLGAENDETVLGAARELDRTVKEAGLDWDGLLRPDDAAEAEPEVDTPVAMEPEAPSAPAVRGDRGEDMKIVERLLARKGLSDTLRSDLEEFKRNIREGTFDKMDADYIRALAKRLGA
jgi:uncharacterized protein YbjT (DUF2867 family)